MALLADDIARRIGGHPDREVVAVVIFRSTAFDASKQLAARVEVLAGGSDGGSAIEVLGDHFCTGKDVHSDSIW